MNITTFQKQLQEEFDSNIKFKYTPFLEDSHFYKTRIERVKEEVELDDDITDKVYFSWLLDLSIIHYEYSIFKLSQDKNDETLEHLSKSCQYGYYALHYGSQSCECFKEKSPFIIQNKAVFIMSNLLLTSNLDEFKTVANHLIDSLNGKSCIIKKGYKDSTISWMILQMVSKYLQKDITLHKLLQPELKSPFKDAVENFDTEDIDEVEKLIYLLCDMHIAIAQQNYEIHYAEQYEEDGDTLGLTYKELFLVGLYQLPFEVLVWLHLRELKGLKNPDFENSSKEFVHPLLQTKISNFYLSLKDKKVELNNDLTYANKLIKNSKNLAHK